MDAPRLSDNERSRYADALQSVDELINLHARKLELLKQYRAGLLQKFQATLPPVTD